MKRSGLRETAAKGGVALLALAMAMSMESVMLVVMLAAMVMIVMTMVMAMTMLLLLILLMGNTGALVLPYVSPPLAKCAVPRRRAVTADGDELS